MGDSRATVIIFEATRVDDVRIYDKYCPTVATYWGTGGARVPYVFELEDEDQVEENNLIAFDTQFGSNANTFENLSPTLKASQQPPSFSAFPIQDGREIEKNQNGLGVGSNTDPSYTLDQTGSQAVAYPIQSTVIGRQDHNGPQGKGYGMETDPMFTLDGAGAHGVATPPAVVRRLTPTECERLQGFPDDWTADQADSNRYKQMGNAVTVNVIQWIGARL
jgi:site-specific DNA-cytosine methylase